MRKGPTDQMVILEILDSEMREYHRSILGLLSRVELDQCDDKLKKDLKTIFCLLNHFCQDNTNRPEL